MKTDKDVSIEIVSIFNNNKLEDLKRFLNKRRFLNITNFFLMYLFHFIQSSGILISSYSAGTNNTTFLWVGIGLNFIATLINIYEKMNSSILKKLIIDIKLIKDDNYLDETDLIIDDQKKSVS